MQALKDGEELLSRLGLMRSVTLTISKVVFRIMRKNDITLRSESSTAFLTYLSRYATISIALTL